MAVFSSTDAKTLMPREIADGMITQTRTADDPRVRGDDPVAASTAQAGRG